MDSTTYDNWVKIKEALEQSGKTESYFYKRACQIAASRVDPGLKPPAFGEYGASDPP